MLNGAPLDQINLPTPSLKSDTSYARIPDGSASWQITPNTAETTTPTIGQSNNIAITIATATPQPQKKPTATAKPKTLKETGTNKQTSNQAQQPSSSQTSSAKSQMPQLQPDWKIVRLPTRIAESTPKTPTTPDIPNTSQPLNTPDIPKKIAISVLVIVLALVLWGCRKLFFKGYPVRDEPSQS
jgi:cobalamin biosynthesis Mg chelatase CobN